MSIKYFAKPKENIKNTRPDGLPAWDSQLIEIFSQEDKTEPIKIGEYKRDYHTFYDTFCPFQHQNGKWYALYSPHYEYTRIMELPSCKDISINHDENGDGFCPTGYYIPNYIDYHYTDRDPIQASKIDNEKDRCKKELKYWDFGFISGCIWGDDWSWKIEYIDLKEADKGIIKIYPKFGYIWLPNFAKINDVIHMNYYDGKDETEIEISVPIRFSNETSYKKFNLTDMSDYIDTKSDEKKTCNECKVNEGDLHKENCKQYSTMPFISYPKLVCKRCGQINFSPMYIADEIWKKYIPYKQEEFQVCLDCFYHIREMIDKKQYKYREECIFCGSKNIIKDPKREKHKYYYNCNDCGSGWY